MRRRNLITTRPDMLTNIRLTNWLTEPLHCQKQRPDQTLLKGTHSAFSGEKGSGINDCWHRLRSPVADWLPATSNYRFNAALAEELFFGTVVVQLKNLICVCLMSILLNSNLHFYNNVHFEHLISTVKNWPVLDCLKLKCLSLWLQCVVNMKQIIFSYFNSKK